MTENFTLEELTRSDTALRRGIDNTPNIDVTQNLLITATWLERVRELLGVPMQITSGYRSPKLNRAIGGSVDSQHCRGEAVDFIAPKFGTPKTICLAILDSDIAFDQLIEEGNWVHISFSDNPRRQALTAHFNGGKVTYTQGIA